jgi:hypothetical protein
MVGPTTAPTTAPTKARTRPIAAPLRRPMGWWEADDGECGCPLAGGAVDDAGSAQCPGDNQGADCARPEDCAALTDVRSPECAIACTSPIAQTQGLSRGSMRKGPFFRCAAVVVQPLMEPTGSALVGPDQSPSHGSPARMVGDRDRWSCLHPPRRLMGGGAELARLRPGDKGVVSVILRGVEGRSGIRLERGREACSVLLRTSSWPCLSASRMLPPWRNLRAHTRTTT